MAKKSKKLKSKKLKYKMKSKLKSKKTKSKKTKSKTRLKLAAIPKGFHTVTPYLFITNAANAIEFYKKALGAKEIMRFQMPDGRVGHAELKIGDSHIMLADEFPEMDARSPQSYGGTPVLIHLYVKNVDSLGKQAEAAGMLVVKPVQDQFYGDRSGYFKDPFGHQWSISTHKENVSSKEIKKRFDEMMKTGTNC